MTYKSAKYSEKDIFEALKAYYFGVNKTQYAKNNNIPLVTIGRWTTNFANDKLILNESFFTKKNLEDLGVNSLEEFKEKFMKVYEILCHHEGGFCCALLTATKNQPLLTLKSQCAKI